MNVDKEKTAIERLKAFEPDDGYYVGYSGGKDSDVIRILSDLAGVKHELHYNLTTVDAPDTVYYVRNIGNVLIDKPSTTMWKLIVKNLYPPTRIVRYCCAELKERSGIGKITVTGVRWAESNNRKQNSDVVKVIASKPKLAEITEKISGEYKQTRSGGIVFNEDNADSRRLVEHCYRTTKTMLNPIVDWTDNEVWEFLNHYGCKSNPLYQCGFHRIGCIGCPMASKKEKYSQFALYPKYKENYIKAFDRMVAARIEKGKDKVWENGKEVFKWWIGEDINQLSFLEE